ncbi:MAG: NifU family protein [Chlamydiia bacterium]|nr:NifU family protein [Chlamydiia bacterium]
MRLVTGREGNLCLYWLIDETDGVIADAKFQAIGPIALLAAAEIACELCLRKNYDQASRLSAELIDRHVRERKDIPAFPKECAPFLNQVLTAIDQAVHQCVDIPYSAQYDQTPLEDLDLDALPNGIEGWETLPPDKKMQIVESVVDKEIRPYIELDAGGIQILDIRDTGEVRISYQGSCTTCHSSTGSTLSAIQQILKARVHPSLTVVPEL